MGGAASFPESEGLGPEPSALSAPGAALLLRNRTVAVIGLVRAVRIAGATVMALSAAYRGDVGPDGELA